MQYTLKMALWNWEHQTSSWSDLDRFLRKEELEWHTWSKSRHVDVTMTSKHDRLLWNPTRESRSAPPSMYSLKRQSPLSKQMVINGINKSAHSSVNAEVKGFPGDADIFTNVLERTYSQIYDTFQISRIRNHVRNSKTCPYRFVTVPRSTVASLFDPSVIGRAILPSHQNR